jgi:hypothetical protein
MQFQRLFSPNRNVDVLAGMDFHQFFLTNRTLSDNRSSLPDSCKRQGELKPDGPIPGVIGEENFAQSKCDWLRNIVDDRDARFQPTVTADLTQKPSSENTLRKTFSQILKFV